ncbi:hypothetical protein BJ138DRAFT_125037, partial [Hygrophoropsis aurantiaca]
LYEIFSYLPDNGEPFFYVTRKRSTGHITLAALAVTCRTFREPALALRWRQLWSVSSLVPLFPRDIWRKYNPTGFHLEFARSPSEEEWTRFESYTSLIREIPISDTFAGTADLMATLSRKYNASPSQQLFPNLRVLKWHHDGGTEPSYAHLFFPPSLRCLQVTLKLGAPEDREVPRLLSLLDHQCPMLTRLSINGIVFDEDNVTILRVLVSRACQRLEYLKCDEVDESTLNYLAKLATLKDLSVYLPDSIFANAVFSKGFVNLQTLSLTMDGISTVIAFLSSTQLSLKSIKIEIASRPQPRLLASLKQLFARLSTSLSHTHLTRIHLMLGDSRAPEGIQDVAVLRPLLLFSELRYVYIGGLCSFNLDDDVLAEFANAWSHLEELTLNRFAEASEVTFKGLKSLIRACPLLQALTLAIHAVQLDCGSPTTPPAGGDSDTHNDKIETLDLGDSAVGDPPTVARILGELFRSLRKVVVYPRDALHAQLWGEVNFHLFTAAQAREREIDQLGDNGGSTT